MVEIKKSKWRIGLGLALLFAAMYSNPSSSFAEDYKYNPDRGAISYSTKSTMTAGMQFESSETLSATNQIALTFRLSDFANRADFSSFKIKRLNDLSEIGAPGLGGSANARYVDDIVSVVDYATNSKAANYYQVLPGTNPARVRFVLAAHYLTKYSGVPISVAGQRAAVTTTVEGYTTAPSTAFIWDGNVTKPGKPTIDSVYDYQTKVTGTAIGGNTVVVMIGKETYEAPVSGNGRYEVTIPKQEAGTVIEVIQKNRLLQESDPEATTVIDSTLAKPQIQKIQGGDKIVKVKGNTIAGYTTVVKLSYPTAANNSSYKTIYAEVGADGMAEFIIPEAKIGQIYKAVQTGPNGKDSPEDQFTVSEDAPVVTMDPPTINGVKTTDTKVTGTGKANHTIDVVIDNNTYTTTVEANGTYSVNIPTQKAGTVISAVQYQASNPDLVSKPVFTVVTDDNAKSMDPPTINGVKTTDTKVTGKGKPDHKIDIVIENKTYTTTVDSNGDYSVTISPQPVGTVILAVQYHDSNPNLVSKPVYTVVTADSSDPIAPPTINTVKTTDTRVTGSGIADHKIDIVIKDKTYTTTVGADGTYSVNVPTQPVGQVISAVQYKASNPSMVSKPAYTVVIADNTATIEKPKIQEIKVADKVVQVLGKPNLTVTLIDEDGYERSVIADATGLAKFKIDAAKDGQKFEAYQSDEFGNKSPNDSYIVQGQISAPTIDTVLDTDTTMTGTGIPGYKIKLIVHGQEYNVTVGEDGKYTVATGKWPAGEFVQVQQSTPVTGKESSYVTTIVKDTTLKAPTISTIRAGDSQIVVTGEPGALVTLYPPTGSPRSVTAMADGKAIFPLGEAAVGGTTYKATQTGKNGKASSETSKVVVHGIYSKEPIIDYDQTDFDNEPPVIIGTAAPGATVYIYDSFGSIVGSGTAFSTEVFVIVLESGKIYRNLTAVAQEDGKLVSGKVKVEP